MVYGKKNEDESPSQIVDGSKGIAGIDINFEDHTYYCNCNGNMHCYSENHVHSAHSFHHVYKPTI